MTKTYHLILSVMQEKLGYIILDDINEDFSLCDYITDSFAFIQFITAIEAALNVELTDDFLDIDLLDSAIGFADKVEDYIINKFSDTV